MPRKLATLSWECVNHNDDDDGDDDDDYDDDANNNYTALVEFEPTPYFC